MQALTAMHNVPFSNSVEVGTEALTGIDKILTHASDILILMELLINHAEPLAEKMNFSMQNGVAIAAGLAECFVRKTGRPFREVYFQINKLIEEAVKDKKNPTLEIMKLINNIEGTNANEYLFWAHVNESIGGTGKAVTQEAKANAEQRLTNDIGWVKTIEQNWKTLENKLKLTVARYINERPST